MIHYREQRWLDAMDLLGDYKLNTRYLAFARKGTPAHIVQHGSKEWVLKGSWRRTGDMRDWAGLYVVEKDFQQPRDRNHVPCLKFGFRRNIGDFSWIAMPYRMGALLSLKAFPLMEPLPCS